VRGRREKGEGRRERGEGRREETRRGGEGVSEMFEEFEEFALKRGTYHKNCKQISGRVREKDLAIANMLSIVSIKVLLYI